MSAWVCLIESVQLHILIFLSIYSCLQNCIYQDAVFTKLLEQEVEFYDKAGPGVLTSYLSQDISGLKGEEEGETHIRARAPPNQQSTSLTHAHSSPFITHKPDILYGNLQRDRGLRAILEAIVGTVLLFKLQPRLGLLFSLVIPSVATITVSLRGERKEETDCQECALTMPECKLSLSLLPLPPYHLNRLNSVGASPRQS